MNHSGSVKVSIIIPYLKDRGWLKDAIRSAEQQDFNSFEVLPWQGNYNLGKNINDALKVANGDWIKILAEDDLLPENSIRDLYNEAIKGYDFVCGDAENFGEDEYFIDGWKDEKFWKGKITNLQSMVISNEIHGGTVLYSKKALFECGGFDESLWTGEEYDMNLMLLAKGYKLGYVNKVVYKYRLHETNKSYYMSAPAKELRREYIKTKIKQKYLKYVL